jgi:hypothetical protein
VWWARLDYNNFVSSKPGGNMRTIETTAVIEPNGKLILQLPSDIPPGQHRVVVVIEEQPILKKPPLEFPVIDVGAWPENLSLRREDLYDDEFDS